MRQYRPEKNPHTNEIKIKLRKEDNKTPQQMWIKSDIKLDLLQ